MSTPAPRRTPTPGSPAGRGRRRGSILLMVLMIIVVLSALIVQFVERGMTELAAEGHYVERDRLRVTAFSALEATLAVVADVAAVEGGLTAPAQGWDNPLEVAGFEAPDGVTINVRFIDESGRLPLGELDEGTLFLLFTNMGLPTDAALDLTQVFLDWVDEDDLQRIGGAESATYETAEWPYAASNQPIKRLSELAVMEGFRELFFDEFGRPNDYYRLFAGNVSAWADGTLNVNSVTDLALRSYAGFGDLQVRALEDYRAGADRILGTADDRYFATPREIAGVLGELPEGVRLGVGISVLRIQVEVLEPGGGRYVLETVVQPQQGGGAGQRTRTTASQPSGTQGTARTATGSAAQATVAYPFVFLEITEDVGHNDSVAAPTVETPATGVASQGR